MARDFEDHCWKDLFDPDTIEIYQAYRRRTYVGDNPAVLAIDLYNKAYLGGDRPVKEVDREFSGSCGENAWRAMPPTQSLFAAARRAGGRGRREGESEERQAEASRALAMGIAHVPPPGLAAG